MCVIVPPVEQVQHLLDNAKAIELPRTTVDLLALACKVLDVETLHWGPAGWTRYEATGLPPVYLRWAPSDRGRLLCRELFIDATEKEPVTAAVLGRVPISALETFINSDRKHREILADRLGLMSPVGGPATGSNLAVLASHYDTYFGVRTDPAVNWCAAAQAATAEDSPDKIRKRKPSTRHQLRLDADYRLTDPPGPDGLSDEFLSRVHRAYVAASMRGEPPNMTIAADVHASPRSVERWVYEARKRGVMPPARARGARG